MRKETPVETHLPEWKKEVAEKVKAYGERKKRLTTPPNPLKQNSEQERKVHEIPVAPSIPLPRETPSLERRVQESSSFARPAEPKQPSIAASEATTAPSPFEIWTDDVQGVAIQDGSETEDENSVQNGPFLMRRLLAGVIDNAMLIIVTLVLLYGFSFFMEAPLEWLIVSSWKGTLLMFLLTHFLYQLYFLRASRQTPGMLFVALEVRDPVITVVPIGKIIVRWLALIFLNVFNVIPVLKGKNFLLLDQLSGTEMRSFK